MNFHLLLRLGLVITSCELTAAGAHIISLPPAADTSIYSAFPNFNFGGGTTLTAGGRPRGGESRALMLFDIVDSLPAGAIIESVTLRLVVVGTPSPSVNSVFDLDRLTRSWGEGNGADRGGSTAGPGQVTWNNRRGSSGSPWSTPGGDFVSTPGASLSILGDPSYTFASTPGLVSDVQAWLDNPASNFGWLLRSESELTGRTIRRFGSRENSTNFPLLTVQYALVPEPGACPLLLLAIAALCGRRLFSA